MTLCTNQRTHFLMACLVYIFAGALPCLIKCRACRTQLHGSRIVAVGATYCIHHFTTPLAPLGRIESVFTLFAHQAWHVGALTCPASSRLYIFLTIYARRTSTQYFTQILNCMAVTTRSVISTRKGIACPHDNHFGTLRQYISLL